MKLLYITTARIPTEKANGIQIIKMCEAFQRQKLDVQLWVPARAQPESMRQVIDLWQYYDVEDVFEVNYLWIPDLIRLEKILPQKLMHSLNYLQYIFFSLMALIRTYAEQDAFYYTRSLQTLFVLCATTWLHRKKIYFEAHEFHGSPQKKHPAHVVLTSLMRWMLSRLDGLVVITQRLKNLYADLGMPESAICIAPDGVDAKRLLRNLDRTDARKALQIPLDKTLVCYTGHLFTWKGVHILAESGRYLPDEYLIYIVGGTVPDQRALRQFIETRHVKNIVLIGYVPYTEVSGYLTAADVLVLPNTSKQRISRDYTSPLKLFEYMSAQRPIVASDLPSLREVLRHHENAVLVSPDDPQCLAKGIVDVIENPELAQRLAETAYADVQQYTWETRATTVLDFVTGKTS